MAMRMARVGMPDNQIAYQLGISIADLRRFFGQDMARAAILMKLYALENLASLALSDDCPEATIFWVETFIAPKSASRNTDKSKEDDEIQPLYIDVPASNEETGE